jgi:UDP-glucose 4-epimerase
VAIGLRPKLRVWGRDYPTADGTGVRDYIHVMDLAQGHVAALAYLEDKDRCITANLGTGRGYSVLEVVRAFEAASGKTIALEFHPRREGDSAKSFADPSLAKDELGWQARFTIDQMCRDSWRWQSQNPNGFAT